MKQFAVALFLEEKEYLLNEFAVCYESFKEAKLADCFDILLFCPRNSNLIEKKYGHILEIKMIEFEPITYDASKPFYQYHFINSIACLATETAQKHLNEYQYVLKTDCDVILCPSLKNNRPDYFTTGIGRFVHLQETQDKLNQFALDKGIDLKHFNIGASWYASGNKIFEAASVTMSYAEEIMSSWWPENEMGVWPGTYKGVTSLYASCLAVQKVCEKIVTSAKIDGDCSKGNVEDYLHVHLWHTTQDFNKFKWRDGEYDAMISEMKEKMIVQGFQIPKDIVEYIIYLIAKR